MKALLALMVVIMSVVISGCASTGALGKSDLAKLGPVRLSTDVDAPKTAYYHGAASNFETMGLIGAAIATIDRPVDQALTEYLEKENIDIRKIVLERFSVALKNTTLSEKMDSHGDNEMKIRIEGYGLGKGAGMSNNMRPSLRIIVTLVSSKKEVLWEGSARVGGATEELPIKTIEEWMKDPEALRAAFSRAADMASSKVLKDYQS